MNQELVGDHSVLDLVNEAITARYKYLVVDVVCALRNNEHWHGLHGNCFSDSFACLIEDVYLAALSTEDKQTLLLLILDTLVNLFDASDEVCMTEARTASDICSLKEWNLVSYELELFILVF